MTKTKTVADTFYSHTFYSTFYSPFYTRTFYTRGRKQARLVRPAVVGPLERRVRRDGFALAQSGLFRSSGLLNCSIEHDVDAELHAQALAAGAKVAASSEYQLAAEVVDRVPISY